jgi:hypothetical protein
MRFLKILLTSLIYIGISPAAHAETPLAVCVKNSNGKISAQRVCAPGTRKLSEKSYSEGRGRFFYVSAKGAQFKTISAAITKINSLYPAADEPVQIRLSPGTFQVSENLTIPSNVHIVGSGRGASVIETTIAQPFIMDNNTAFRDLTINCTSPESGNVCIQASDKTGIQFENVGITVESVIGDFYGISLNSSTAQLNKISITGSSGGFFGISVSGIGAIVDINNASIEVSPDGGFGIAVASGAELKLRNSQIKLTKLDSTSLVPSAIRITGSTTKVDIRDVVAELTNTQNNCCVVYVTDSTDVLISNSKLSCFGNSAGALASGDSASVKVLGSYIRTDATMATVNAFNNATVKIAGSILDGNTIFVYDGGDITCSGITDENFAFSQSTCP